MLAVIKIRHDPRTAVYIAKQRANGKTNKEAIRSLKRHLVRRVYHLLKDPNSIANHRLLDIGAFVYRDVVEAIAWLCDAFGFSVRWQGAITARSSRYRWGSARRSPRAVPRRC